MPHIAFVAPHFLENTNRYVRAFTAIPGVTLSVISDDPASAIPKALKPFVAGHYRVPNSLDGHELAGALRFLSRTVGTVDRLTGALEQLQVPMGIARDVVGIEGMGQAVARNFRDKDRMKQVLRAHDVPVARSGLVTSMQALRSFAESVGYPIIVKPQAGLGAKATFRIASEDDITALADQGHVPSLARPLQAEEFVRAREHTCETVTIRGKAVWRSGTRYLPSPLEVLENPWMQYCVLLPREDDDTVWTRFAPTNEAALAALFGDAADSAAGTALSHMEWFLKDDGTALVNEVGVRPPGVAIMPLMSLAHETDFIAAWAELIALDRFTPKKRTWAAGAAFLRGHGAGRRVASVTGVRAAADAAGDALVELRAPKVGDPRSESYEGEGLAIVRHRTTEGAKAALLAVIQNVRVRYA